MARAPEQLILASASPRRRELLERMGLRFDCCAANVEEHEDPTSDPAEMVRHNAGLKASTLSSRFPNALVLGSDTTVALETEVLNKPADLDQARAMLRRLSGRSHTVYTAVALCWEQGKFEDIFAERSTVHFKTFNDSVIDSYFEQVNPLDKAGAYGIQQARELIIDSVEGSVENVMGLPIQTLERRLAEHGFDFKV